ncbi:MAG: cellulase family glycosylhydrolase [Bacteroidales bacterium]|nr:cellulase family glycosylhydrolase [Candidatus Liminaster caballi]
MKKLSILFMALVCSIALSNVANAQIHKWGDTSRLRVEGNHLVDQEGNQVMLHGVMDTPSPYFSGFRWGYNCGYGYESECLKYFEKLFSAVTDTAQGSWCNVFRLHLDPCWTNDPSIPSSGSDTGEANISQFSKKRLTDFLQSLYLPLARKAKNHGMYVIMRPPGVCPQTIQVGGAYQQYLLTVWDVVSKMPGTKSSSDWLSLELANEPVRIVDANGNETNAAMHDFFQPIVEKIRANGFKGIIWIPGGTWQQNYRPYAEFPITDPMTDADGNPDCQIGYAVHFYPGWFSTSDSQTDTIASIRSFLGSVPVVKTSPIMITEVDWSPQNPNGQGHYNESGQWVLPNYGTWATGSTSKFGKGFKAVVDYFGNIGWTLTHTHDYIDIDRYLADKTVVPAFTGAMNGDAYEACSGACFKWYPQYAHTEHKARVWNTDESSEMFPLNEFEFNPSIWENGTFDPATGKLVTGQYGFGGWQYASPLDLSDYQYVVVKLKRNAPGSASFRMFSKSSSYWSSPYMTGLGGRSTIAIPLHNRKNDDGSAFDPSHIYIAGFWTNGGNSEAIYIDQVFVSNDGSNPVGIECPSISDLSPAAVETFNLNGQRTSDDARGFVIRRLGDGRVVKAFVK